MRWWYYQPTTIICEGEVSQAMLEEYNINGVKVMLETLMNQEARAHHALVLEPRRISIRIMTVEQQELDPRYQWLNERFLCHFCGVMHVYTRRGHGG